MHAALYVKQKDQLIFTYSNELSLAAQNLKPAPRTEQPAGH
jgi:hypothetical protein